ncbi:MAG: hypothetical protein ABI870_04930 [Rhodanobacter sp.]
MNNKMVWLLVLLVTGNLALTAYVALRPAAVGAAATAAAGESVISESKANDLAKDFVALYNKKDPVALYAKLDNLARVQISQEQLAQQIQKLHSVLGDVTNYAYVNSELAGTTDGKAFYNANYKVALSGATFAHGTMKLTFVKNSDGFGLVGLFINGADSGLGH